MQFMIIVLLVCFFLFLYVLYFLSKDDFVILRRDIPLDRIFNIAFLASVLSLISSRLFYVISDPKPIFLNPLGFLLFPYFPGLSQIGAVIGGLIFVILYSNWKKMPSGKFLDLFAFSYLSVMPIGYLGLILLNLRSPHMQHIVSFFIYILVLVIFGKLLLPYSYKGVIKDGSLGLLFLITFSSITFLLNVIFNFQGISFFLKIENIGLIVLFASSVIFLFEQEMVSKVWTKK